MSKHNIGDKVRHSRHGEGQITAIRQVEVTPPPFDPVKLDAERWTLRARIAEIDAILARGTEPKLEDFCTVQYDGGRAVEYDPAAIDKLRERATT